LKRGLSPYEHEPRPGLGVRGGQSISRAKQRNLRSARPTFVRADGRLALEHPYERVEGRIDGARKRTALWQLDVHYQPCRAQLDWRALADEDADDCVALPASRNVVWPEHLRRGLHVLVAASQVHPEQDAPHLADLPLAQLVLANAFGVPHATTSADLQERSRLQPRALDCAAGTGGVTRARAPRQEVPEIVEPAMGMACVQRGALGRDRDDGFVHEDEGIHLRIRNAA
jgi:hypothetical protein